MTEKEYIIVSNRTHLNNAINILDWVDPSLSDIINEKEFREIRKKLREWRDKSHSKIDITDE